MKTVHVEGHAFDCLPGHVTVTGRGVGSNVRIALIRAVGSMFSDDRLRRKRVRDFKMSVRGGRRAQGRPIVTARAPRWTRKGEAA